MEEDIKILESIIENHKDYFCGNYKLIDDMTITLRDIDAIENIIVRNKELEKHYEHEQEYINGEVFSAKQMHFIDDEYIPKSKIKEIIGIKMQKNNDIIHCYKKKYGKDIYWYDKVQQAYFENRIYKELWEELLEENNKKVKMNITKISKHIPILDFDDIDKEENKNE